MQQTLDHISDLETQKNKAAKEQVRLAAQVLIAGIRNDDASNLQQLLGCTSFEQISASDLVLEIRKSLLAEQ